jgi:ABC-type lipoprotein export system ATPase subunit
MESTPTPIIDITNLAISSPGTPGYDDSPRLAVTRGNVIAVVTDSPTDGRYLLRILATLAQPQRGEYHFNGKTVDLTDYRQCLAVKRQIGYVAPDAAMISNRTLRENLLLSRFYDENNLSIDIDQTIDALCKGANLSPMLNRRPSVMNEGELLKAIAIREMGKAPAVMLIDRPENFMEISEDDRIFNHFKNMVRSGTAVVFISTNTNMNRLANRQLTVAGGTIRTTFV